jgi:hypothetical protein
MTGDFIVQIHRTPSTDAPAVEPALPRHRGWFGRAFDSAAARMKQTAVVGVLLVGATACAEAPSAGAGVDPAALEDFLGNDLRFIEDRDFGLDISETVDDPEAPGGTVLRTSYPAGSASRGVDDAPEGGMQAYLERPEPVDVLDLTYQVRFPEGFDFVKGGKLPGLYGGTEHSGGDIPDGTSGLSTRYMWRTGGEGEVYAYLATSKEDGTSLGRGCWTFTPGEWTTLRQRVQLNSPDATDGRISVWQNDRLVLDKGGLQFRTTDQLQIEGLFFSTFFGGGDESWASPTDQNVEFAGFTLAEGSEPPAGQPPASGDDDDCGTPATS